MDEKAKQGRLIQRRIREVLFEFNPIGFSVPADEYDCLISEVYRRLRETPTPRDMAEYLEQLETEFGGARPAKALMPFAEELCQVDVRLRIDGEAT